VVRRRLRNEAGVEAALAEVSALTEEGLRPAVMSRIRRMLQQVAPAEPRLAISNAQGEQDRGAVAVAAAAESQTQAARNLSSSGSDLAVASGSLATEEERWLAWQQRGILCQSEETVRALARRQAAAEQENGTEIEKEIDQALPKALTPESHWRIKPRMPIGAVIFGLFAFLPQAGDL